MKEAPGPDGLVGVEVVFLSEAGCGELVLMLFYPVIQGGAGNLDLETAAHCPLCHADRVTLVIVCECRENDLWRVGRVRKLALSEAFIAGFAKICLDRIFL